MAKLDKKLKKNKTDGKLLKAREEMAKDLEVAENLELSFSPFFSSSSSSSFSHLSMPTGENQAI